MKKRIAKIALILVLIICVAYVGIYAYWGRNHKVLYSVDNVNFNACDDGSYDYEIVGTVRNWPHKFWNTKEYSLTYSEQGDADYDCQSEEANVKVSGLKKNEFVIKGNLNENIADNGEELEQLINNRIEFQEDFFSITFSSDDLDGYDLFMADFEKNTDVTYHE